MGTKVFAGRPSKNDEFKLYDSGLYKLLVDKLPGEFIKAGRIDTLKLSEATRNARFTVYRWLNEQKLSPKAVKALTKISLKTSDPQKKGALTKEDLYPFLGL